MVAFCGTFGGEAFNCRDWKHELFCVIWIFVTPGCRFGFNMMKLPEALELFSPFVCPTVPYPTISYDFCESVLLSSLKNSFDSEIAWIDSGP